MALTVDSPVFQNNLQKIEIFQWLKIIRSVKMEGGPYTGYSKLCFKIFYDRIRQKIMHPFSFRNGEIDSENKCREELINTVEKTVPKEALILIQRVLDGKIIRNDVEGYSCCFDGKIIKLDTIRKGCSMEDWINFFQKLERDTRYTQAYKDKILYILRRLGVFKTEVPDKSSDEDDVIAYICTGTLDFTITPLGTYTEPSFRNLCSMDKLFDFVMEHISKSALKVAELIYEGAITNVSIIHETFSGNEGLVRHINFMKDHTSYRVTQIIQRFGDFCKSASVKEFNVDESFDKVLSNFRCSQSEDVVEVVHPVPCISVPPTVHSSPTSSTTLRSGTEWDKLPCISFGRSRAKTGVFVVNDPDESWADVMQLNEDGYWTNSLTRKTMVTDCLFDATEGRTETEHPWIEASFAFSKLYNPEHKYIIFADCDEKDKSHPAVAFYTMTLMMIDAAKK